MASPSDLVPNKYEVVKLITGAEVCGMTRELKMVLKSPFL